MCDIFKYQLYFRFVKGMKVIKILDNYPYIKNEAIKELQENFDWKPYKMKHYESRFTRFYESYWTTKKHGLIKEEHISQVKFFLVKSLEKKL